MEKECKLLEEGDIIELKEGYDIYASVPEHFIFNNRRGSFLITHAAIRICGEMAYFAGRYVVYKVNSEGGGKGHGSNDSYPDGHHVFCERIDDPTVKVDFFQSGCFTATIKNIEPVGKAKLRWCE